MKNLRIMMCIGICVAALGMGYGLEAQETYEVTVTNLTRGQVVTPPLLATHSGSFVLFDEGEKAKKRLYTLAETGATGPFAAKLQTNAAIFDVVEGTNVIFPGDSLTLQITADSSMPYLSAIGMLAQTNDAFFGLKGAMLPSGGEAVFYAPAYDAGSEANNEMGAFIPGPPFGGSQRATKGAEGFIHIHAGIHGIADLAPEMYDWRNPVVKITVKRTN